MHFQIKAPLHKDALICVWRWNARRTFKSSGQGESKGAGWGLDFLLRGVECVEDHSDPLRLTSLWQRRRTPQPGVISQTWDQPGSRQALPPRDAEREGNKRTSATSSRGVFCSMFHLRPSPFKRTRPATVWFCWLRVCFFFLFFFFWERFVFFFPPFGWCKKHNRPLYTGMMWTSHETVGFVFLAGFCVQFGLSFEGKNGMFFFGVIAAGLLPCMVGAAR